MKRYNVQLYVLNQRIDLLESESIVIRSAIQDVKDVRKVFTDFSHEFKVPASRNNNRVFQHLLRSDTTTLDPRAYHEAFIEIDNAPFRRGFVLVNRVQVKSGVDFMYSVRFFGGLVSIPRVLSDDYLRDLSFFNDSLVSGLSYETLPARDTAINGFLTQAQPDSNFIITLNAFNEGFFYSSGGTEESNRIEGFRNIYFGDAANNNRNFNGVDLDQQRASVRNRLILESIEREPRYRGQLLFSRGIDAAGLPTAISSEVVTDHFFNTPTFTESLMLLTSKVENTDLDARPSEDLVFDRVWPIVTADSTAFTGSASSLNADGTVSRAEAANFGGTFVGVSDGFHTTSAFNVYLDNDENGNIRSSRYYIDATITGTGGAWRVDLYDTTDGVVVWSTGDQESGTFQSNNETSDNSTYPFEEDLTTAEGRGSNQADPSTLTLGGGQRLTGFSRQQGRHTLVFRLRREEGVTITVPPNGVQIKNVIRSKVPWRRFSVDTKVTGNTLATATGINQSAASYVISHRIPRVRVTDWLTGIWKMFNLTADVQQDAQGRNIIVVDTLDNYYNRSGRTLDITEWVNSQEYEIEAPIYFNPIIFKYREPRTYTAKEFFEENRDTRKYGYGSISYDSTDAGFDFQLPFNEYTVGLPFEQIVLNGITDEADDTFNSNIVYGWIVNESRNPTSPAPIIHYAENVTPTASILGRDNMNMPVEITQYNALTKSLIIDNREVQSLTFSVENNERLTYTAGESVVTERTLFNTFYSNYISTVFNKRARIYTYNARLPKYILTSLTLADTLVVGNSFFRINTMEADTSTGRALLELISTDDTTSVLAPPVTALNDNLAIASFTSNLLNGNIIGDSITLSVIPTGGRPAYEYLWQKNGMVIEGAVDAIYTDSASAVGDTYCVTVTDQESNMVKSTTITVVTEVTRNILTHMFDGIHDENGDNITYF